MSVVMQLTCSTPRGEIVLALNRCILEASINCEFLLAKDDDSLASNSSTYSLGPERELG